MSEFIELLVNQLFSALLPVLGFDAAAILISVLFYMWTQGAGGG